MKSPLLEACGTTGAVHKPVCVIEPAQSLQVTTVLLVPMTVAVNCCLLPDGMVTLFGVTFTITSTVLDNTRTVRVKPRVVLCPEESVTFAVKAYDPATAVIPMMFPLEGCSWIPDGKKPIAILHW